MANVYDKARDKIGAKVMTWGSDTINVILLRSDGGGPPVFVTTHSFVSDMLAPATSVEVTVASYSRQTVGTKTDAINGSNYEYKCGDVTFSGLETGQTIGAAVVYRELGADSVDEVLSFHDFTDVPTNGSDIVFNPASGVVFTINP